MASTSFAPLPAHWLPPQIANAIRQLEKRSVRDLHVAKLTLGLYAFVSRDPREAKAIFPGYQWANADVWSLPPRLRGCAKVILEWSFTKELVLNAVLLSESRIIAAIGSMLKRSPFSRHRRKIADDLRRKYPCRKKWKSELNNSLDDVAVLPNLVGHPISESMIRVMLGFRPSRIVVLRHDDPLLFPHTFGAMSVRLKADGYTVESLSLTVAAPKARQKSKKIEGWLDEYSATGTEGLRWVIEDFDGVGFEKLNFIEAGDHLTIQDRLGRKAWSGVIKCDRKAGWRRYPLNPKYGQPSALGFWIHWTQRGFKPEKWARFFVRPEHDRLYGMLVRKDANRQRLRRQK